MVNPTLESETIHPSTILNRRENTSNGNNNIDFYMVHTPEIQINALYKKICIQINNKNIKNKHV